MLADCHIHTEFSYDSNAKMIEYVNQAKKIGLNHICFTDHVDLNKIDPGYLYYDPKRYFIDGINSVRHLETNDFYIGSGVEFGEPHLYKENLRRLQSYNYDMIIGSLHYLGKLYLYPQIKKTISSESFYSWYWKSMREVVESNGFDVLGHFDNPKKSFGEVIYDEQKIIEIFKILLDGGKIIEINTASIRNGLGELTPDVEFLEMYKFAGGKYVTIGSDAHNANDIGSDINKAKKVIKRLDLKEVVFKNRKMLEIS